MSSGGKPFFFTIALGGEEKEDKGAMPLPNPPPPKKKNNNNNNNNKTSGTVSSEIVKDRMHLKLRLMGYKHYIILTGKDDQIFMIFMQFAKVQEIKHFMQLLEALSDQPLKVQ